MKNQYFGDINDYKKYGLLRAIVAGTDLKVLVAWMLTPNDGGPDGKFTAYLDKPKDYRHHDPDLFDGLKRLLVENPGRHVELIETTDLIPKAVYFSELVPDSGTHRLRWFEALVSKVWATDFVFLDPDNGMEVKSRPYGRRLSSQYLYWREVEQIWAEGKSLLIYQHFIREKRPEFVQRMLYALSEVTPGSIVEAFLTANVVFLMALQPEHQKFHGPILETVYTRWANRIRHWRLVKDSLEENVGTYTIGQVLDALNTHKIRATYSAVASLLGAHPRSLAGQFLGNRRPYASWVVSRETGMPSGYLPENCHPDLQNKARVIEDPAELINLIRGS